MNNKKIIRRWKEKIEIKNENRKEERIEQEKIKIEKKEE